METIKIEVIWPLEKNLFIKLLIKTFNGKRMGQNSLKDMPQIVQSEEQTSFFPSLPN